MASRKFHKRSALVVRRRPGTVHHGLLLVPGLPALPAALGRGGTAYDKREGDGRTPAGLFHVLAGYYRADRMPRPVTRLPLAPLRRDDGWCDAAGDRRYNRPVRLPLQGLEVSHERMWRRDAVYDVVLVIDHNRRPRVQGRGSAVFIHLARPGFAPTEGCIALRRADMMRLLARLGPGQEVRIRHG